MIDEDSLLSDHRSADLWPRRISNFRSRLFNGPWVETLSRSRIMENIHMVALEIRDASMFHPADLQEIIDVRKAAVAAGVGMVARKAGGRVFKVFLFNDRRADMARLIPDADETMGDREFIVAQITMANFTGAFLDYPKCCTDSFVTHLMNATDQDAEAMKALADCEDPDPRAYFVERFVPCSPDCEHAIREGIRVENELSDKDSDVLPEYLRSREEHMIDVREGRIVEEKLQRDRMLEMGG